MAISPSLRAERLACLRRAELSALWQQYKERNCQKAREQLIAAYYHLARVTAGRLFTVGTGGVERDDLIGTGVVGLVRAVDQFDHARGIKFETYAITLIRGAILEMLRGDDWVPRLVRDQHKQLKQAQRQLEARLGRLPTEAEVAEEMGVTPEKLDKMRADIGRRSLLSLDDLRMGSEQERLLDLVPALDAPVWESVWEGERARLLERAVQKLPLREQRVLRLYYQAKKTFLEIGTALGVSESRAYQLHAQAMKRLRGYLVGDEEAFV